MMVGSNLEDGDVMTINGLDGYALPKLLKRLDYARPHIVSNS